MATFVDKASGCWPFELDFGLLADVKREAGVDLAAAMASPERLFAVAFGEPGAIVATLWVLCDPAARGVTPEAWARLFNGAALESAATALVEAVVDFSPRSGVAAAVRNRLPEILGRMDAAAIAAIDRALSSGGTGSPGPPASTPGGTPSGP